MSDGWADSAAAWVSEQGEAGNYGRRHVRYRRVPWCCVMEWEKTASMHQGGDPAPSGARSLTVA